jgi:2-desacetyl-2-hydroxyethyl bacteriochlorophyllide A dehydrogenase
MSRLTIFFTAPYEVTVREEPEPQLGPDQVMVETLFSGISHGTEHLIYCGRFPEDLVIDENIPLYKQNFSYPLTYGYSAVGRVVETGARIDTEWKGRLVFAFKPHCSLFTASPDELIEIPPDISPKSGIFLPNMETAVNLIMDGRPMIGEKVLVCGQGIVGLFTTALLAHFPLESLIALDKYRLRRDTAVTLGAHACLNPDAVQFEEAIRKLFPDGADLAFELSGAIEALDETISLTGFNGRVIIGSWYGNKRSTLNLGGRFHRSRIRLISSQVSTLAPELRGRWTKSRRFEVSWQMLREIKPERFITHKIPATEAARAYELLERSPGETIQIMLTY